MSFLTIEDINTAYSNFEGTNMFHIIDTSNISLEEFEDVKYDFCIINHFIGNSQNVFEFNIVNELWSGGYVVLDSDNNYIDSTVSFDGTNTVLTIVTDLNVTSIKLILYCTNNVTRINIYDMKWLPMVLPVFVSDVTTSREETIEIINHYESDITGEDVTITYRQKYNPQTEVSETINFYLDDLGKLCLDIPILPTDYPICILYNNISYYYRVLETKSLIDVEVTDILKVGKLNKVILSVDSKYKEVSSFITSVPCFEGYAIYNGVESEIYFENGNYYIDIDLRDKLDKRPIVIKIIIKQNDIIQDNICNLTVNCDFVKVNDYGSLVSEITSGNKVVELNSDITFVDSINVDNSVIIRGNNKTINLNDFSFILGEKKELKIANVHLINGDPAIIQSNDSKVNLIECLFNNCRASNYNDLGSIIHCDIDLESLSVSNDFRTELSNCIFYDNSCCIFHGGELIVDKCKLNNTDVEIIDKDNPSFLFQVDGECLISNSVFDINYSTDYLCSNNKSVGFAQALIKCGLNAIINGASYDTLKRDESLPFFEVPYNNRSHLLCKYYYSKIRDCVYSSPIENKEDKSACHCVSGLDWVYKNNIKVTRVSDATENHINGIEW